jgi:transposase-like protein
MDITVNIEKIRAQLTRIDREKRALEQKIQVIQRKKLVALPKQVGLDSVDSLIAALAHHASPSVRVHLQSMSFNGLGSSDSAQGSGNARRVRFSAEMRARIKAELETGKKSVAQISREYGPSHPTIMGWKREWGMTHPKPRRVPGTGNGVR